MESGENTNDIIFFRVSPCEKYKEKGQSQKVQCVFLNMKEKQTTCHSSTFLPHFFAFWDLFAILGLGPKNAFVFKIIFSKLISSLKNIIWFSKLYIYVKQDPLLKNLPSGLILSKS